MASFFQHRGKEKVKVQVDLCLRKIANVPTKNPLAEQVYIECTKAKSKRLQDLKTTPRPVSNEMCLNETLSFSSTLYRDVNSRQYMEKVAVLVLKQKKNKKKLAEWKLDISQCFSTEEAREYTLLASNTKTDKPASTLTLLLRGSMLGRDFMSELPEELIEAIFAELDDQSLMNAGRTCKNWLRLASDLFFHMGLARTKQYVEHDAAIMYYSRAIHLDSRFLQAYLMRGKELLRKGDRAVAVGDLRQALNLEPSEVELHVIKSIVFGIEGRFQSSIDEADLGLEKYPNEPMLYFERAFAKHDLLDFPGTVADYTRCLELSSSTTYLYPGAFLVFNNRAWAYEMMGEWDKAIFDYSQSVYLNPKYVRALRGRARVRSKTGRAADLRGAIADLFTAVLLEPRESTSYDRYLHYKFEVAENSYVSEKGGDKITPSEMAMMIEDAKATASSEYPENHKLFATGFVKQELGDFAGAIADYTKSIAHDYANAYLAYNNRGRANQKIGNVDNAIEDFSQAIATTPADVAKGFLAALGNRCSALSSKGDLQGALADSLEMIRLDPKNSYGYRLHASVLVDHKRRDEAIEFLGRGIAMCPLDDSIYEMRGIFYYEKGDRDKAVSDLSNAIALNPKSYEAYNYRARARSAVGDVEGALKDCNEMIRLEKNNHLGWTLFAAVLADHKKFEEALAAATNAIKICPKNTYRNRAEIYSDQGNLEAAIADYTEAINIDGQDINSFKQRAYARASLNLMNDSLNDYSAATRLGAFDIHTFTNLANTRALTGDFPGATADYNQALALNPRDTEILLNRGTVAFASGNFANAEADYQEVLRLNPDEPDAKRFLQKLVEVRTSKEPVAADKLRVLASTETLYFKYDSTFEKPIGRTKTRLEEMAAAGCGQK